MQDPVLIRILSILAEQLGVDPSELTPETSLLNDLNIDSLDIVELIMEFEDQFEITIPDEDAEVLKTVADLIAYLKRRFDEDGGDAAVPARLKPKPPTDASRADPPKADEP